MGKPRADDYEDEEGAVQALGGAAQPAGNADEVGGLLLELVAAVTKADVLLREMDPEGFGSVRPRLLALQRATAGLPDSGRARRKVGFVVEPKPKRKRAAR